MTDLSRRQVLVGGLALTAASLTAQWARAADGAAHLRFVQPWEFNSIEPVETGYLFNRICVTENLVAAQPDGSVVPALATEWSATEDGTRWTFVLRDGVVFHDGTPLTPEAVRNSFLKLFPTDPQLAALSLKEIETGDKTVTLVFGKAVGTFLAYAVNTTASIYAPSSFDAEGKVVKIVATGPYAIETVEIPTGLGLRRHEAYWDGKPAFETVRVDAVANGETRANIAIGRDADIVTNVPTQSSQRIAAAGMTVDSIIAPRTHHLVPNCNKPQFSDVAVRRALSRAIDRAGIARAIMGNAELAASQYMPPTLKDWYFADLADQYAFDPDKANAELDAAGWARGSDGIREKDGARFAGRLITFPNRPELPIIASALQAMWREVGYDMQITVADWSAIMDARADGTLDVALTSRNLVIIPDPIGTVEGVYSSSRQDTDAAVLGWSNADLDAAVETYLSTTDDAARPALRRRMMEVAQNETPLIPVTWYDQIVAVSDRLTGFVNDPYELSYHLGKVAPRP